MAHCKEGSRISTTQRKRTLDIGKQEPGTRWPEEEKQNLTDLVLHRPFLSLPVSAS